VEERLSRTSDYGDLASEINQDVFFYVYGIKRYVKIDMNKCLICKKGPCGHHTIWGPLAEEYQKAAREEKVGGGLFRQIFDPKKLKLDRKFKLRVVVDEGRGCGKCGVGKEGTCGCSDGSAYETDNESVGEERDAREKVAREESGVAEVKDTPDMLIPLDRMDGVTLMDGRLEGGLEQCLGGQGQVRLDADEWPHLRLGLPTGWKEEGRQLESSDDVEDWEYTQSEGINEARIIFPMVK
jgi:hypothetical protein